MSHPYRTPVKTPSPLVRATALWFECSILGAALSWSKLFRRVCGGHWELWHIDAPVHADIWFRRPHDGSRPGLARGRPVCEDWP